MTETDLLSAAVDPSVPERRQSRSWIRQPRLSVVLYVLAFVSAEALGAFVSIPLQAGVVAVLLVVALNHAVLGYRNRQTAGLVMAVLFASRLVVLTLPTDSLSLATRTGIMAAVSIFMASMADWVLGFDVPNSRRMEGFALKKPIVSKHFTTALIAFTGIPLGFAVAGILDPQRPDVHAIGWVGVLLALVLGAAAEELLYRRLLTAMVQHTAMTQAPWISGIVFGATYLASGSWAMVGLMVLAGVIFAWSCERTGSILGPFLAHAIASILALVILAG